MFSTLAARSSACSLLLWQHFTYKWKLWLSMWMEREMVCFNALTVRLKLDWVFVSDWQLSFYCFAKYLLSVVSDLMICFTQQCRYIQYTHCFVYVFFALCVAMGRLERSYTMGSQEMLINTFHGLHVAWGSRRPSLNVEWWRSISLGKMRITMLHCPH